MPTAPDFSTETPDSLIVSDTDFFPELSLQALRDYYRVDNTEDKPLLENLRLSMYEVDDELMGWVCDQVRMGFFLLSELPKPAVIELYKSAVYSKAAAKNLAHYRNYDTTHAANDKAQQMAAMADSYDEQGNKCINMIRGDENVTISLI